MKSLDPIPLHAATLTLAECSRFTAADRPALAWDRLEATMRFLGAAAGFTEKEQGVVRAMLDAKRSAGRSEYEMAHGTQIKVVRP